MINPTVKIISLMVFAVMVQRMQTIPLAICAGGMVVAIGLKHATDYLLLLKRARWLLISIALIYAYATPGEFVRGIPDAWAPTYEGLQGGVLQALRLVLMLAALALLLATSSRAQFMAGIYQLLKPFRCLGTQPERFAARLWLTLHYVEHMPPGTLKTLRQQGWNLSALENLDEGPEQVVLEFASWHWPDYLVIALLPALWWSVQ